MMTDVLLPILLMVAVGAIARWRFKLDVGTLSKLNLWIFSPAFIFDRVANSTLSWQSMGGVALITVLQVALLGLTVFGFGKLFGVGKATITAMALGAMFYNSGNFGIALAEMAYPRQLGTKDGAATQAFVAMSQNFLVFTVGMWLASRHKEDANWRSSLRAMFTLPAIPVLAAALVARWYVQLEPGVNHLPVTISKTMGYLAMGLVPVSLVTVGAQLASRWRRPRWKPVLAVCGIRLVGGPLQMAAMLWIFHRLGWGFMDLWPWPAEVLIVTSAVPTAVNTLLLTIETGGDTELAADCVFWTTVFSAVTLGVTLAIARAAFGTV